LGSLGCWAPASQQRQSVQPSVRCRHAHAHNPRVCMHTLARQPARQPARPAHSQQQVRTELTDGARMQNTCGGTYRSGRGGGGRHCPASSPPSRLWQRQAGTRCCAPTSCCWRPCAARASCSPSSTGACHAGRVWWGLCVCVCVCVCVCMRGA
jgi:hypothetical protein